jgi:uncharacterized membrane protein YoaK (UPF0700 family)
LNTTAVPATAAPTPTTHAGLPQGWWSAIGLCAASGIADAAGFIQSGVFAANMTGNTVLAGLSVASQNWGTAAERALTLATFFAGAIAGRALLRAASGRSWLALGVEAAMLAVSVFLDPHSALAIWLIAAAMGVQSTGMTRFGSLSISTVVVTSTLSRLGESLVDYIVPRRQPANTGPSAPPARLLVAAWACYGLGALAAALLLRLTPYALLLPAALVLLVAVFSARTPAAGSAAQSRPMSSKI